MAKSMEGQIILKLNPSSPLPTKLMLVFPLQTSDETLLFVPPAHELNAI
jgi:hypothetical protein